MTIEAFHDRTRFCPALAVADGRIPGATLGIVAADGRAL
jgi:hypothetical protein